MKKLIILSMLVVSFIAMKAQSIAIYKGETPIAVHQSTEMDSIVFLSDNQSVTPPYCRP